MGVQRHQKEKEKEQTEKEKRLIAQEAEIKRRDHDVWDHVSELGNLQDLKDCWKDFNRWVKKCETHLDDLQAHSAVKAEPPTTDNLLAQLRDLFQAIPLKKAPEANVIIQSAFYEPILKRAAQMDKAAAGSTCEVVEIGTKEGMNIEKA